MKIALVTPWPPQHTGIADYARDLAAGLVRHGHPVHVFCQETTPVEVEGIVFSPVGDEEIPDLSSYDNIVYQMGNNTSFHLYMLPILRKFGGTVHLHDMVLHHLMAWLTWAQGDTGGYLNLINTWYGPTVTDCIAQMMKAGVLPWDSPVVTDVPLFEEVVQYADSCVVHSDFARRAMRSVFPSLPCALIPQVYDGIPTLPVPSDENRVLRIGVFGGVDPQKRVDTVIRSVAELVDAGRPCKLDIVGAVDNRCQGIYELVKELRVSKDISIHGRASEPEFDAIMGRCDICVSLRYPTMGETSAIVMKALQRGIPTVVSDTGWYAELPEFVLKVPAAQDMQRDLTQTLTRLMDDRALLNRHREKTTTYAETDLNFDHMIDDYGDFLQNNPIAQNTMVPIADESIQRSLAVALSEMGIADSPADQPLLHYILDSVEECL
jgi:glycosyltransferase involved in cell wall biosynthesis